MIRKARLALAAPLIPVLVACGGPSTITRREGEAVWQGRAVPPEAYAWYARGLRFEAEKKLPEALNAFEHATRADPESGSAWAARGRVLCRQGADEAWEAFASGLERADEHVPLLVARGHCRLERDQPELAKEDAEAALARQPESEEASVLLESSLRASGEAERAHAVALGRLQWQAARGFHRPHPEQLLPPEPTIADVDAAIRTGQLEQARRLATGLLTPGVLSLRLLALGQPRLAQHQAELVLRVDPDQSDAWLATWLLASSKLEGLPDGRLSTLGSLLLADYLGRTAGADAARLYLGKLGPLIPADALELELLERWTPSTPTPRSRLAL